MQFSCTFNCVLVVVSLCAVARRMICVLSSSFVAVAIAVLDRAGERLLGALNAPLETLPVDDSGSAAALSQRR